MSRWAAAIALCVLLALPATAAQDHLLVRQAAEAVRTAYHCPQFRTAAELRWALRDRDIELASPAFAPTWLESIERIETLFETTSLDEKPQLCEVFWGLYGDEGSAERGWLEVRPQ